MMDELNPVVRRLKEPPLVDDPASKIKLLDFMLELRFFEISKLYVEVNELRELRRIAFNEIGPK